MKINTIILDIGNVLVSFCWKKHFQNLGFSESMLQKVANATVLSSQWDEFDKGVLSEEELLELFIKNNPAIEHQIRQMYENIDDMIEVFDYSCTWIQHLKGIGLGVYILSNFSSKQYRESTKKLAFLNETDGFILSFQEKLIKPDDRIYQLLLTRYNLNPNNCVFIDDKLINIQAAKNNGLHGIIFTSYDEVLAKLKKFDIK